MSHPNPSTALARVIVDELVAGGVSVVVISPGSRSGALAIAAVEHEELTTRVFIDERSAAFHALGIARASRRPVAVVGTSGTAVANFFPAIVEADMSCVPLIAVTADRPASMHGVGANQTIDQNQIYGSKVRASISIEAPDASTDRNTAWRTMVSRLVGEALGAQPGPAHLNAAFAEPTVPVPADGRTSAEPYPFPTERVSLPTPDVTTDVVQQSPVDVGGSRGLVVAGDGSYDRGALAAAASSLGWPVLATALSGLRGGSVVTAYGRILRDGIPAPLLPEVVVAVGSIGPEPLLEDLVAGAAERFRIDAWGRMIDPRRNATQVIGGDPVDWLQALSVGAEDGWSARWLEAESVARDEVSSPPADASIATGGAVAAALNEIDWGALVVASSLPIREVDAHLRRGGPVYANRGASGIDGFVSTALGVGSVAPRTLALCGDLSFLHDSNGFLHDGDVDLTLIVMDNGGGGLFDSLPQATHAPHYERLFFTPHGRDLPGLASFHGLPVSTVAARSALIDATSRALDEGGTRLIVVPIDRSADAAARRQPSV